MKTALLYKRTSSMTVSTITKADYEPVLRTAMVQKKIRATVNRTNGIDPQRAWHSKHMVGLIRSPQIMAEGRGGRINRRPATDESKSIYRTSRTVALIALLLLLPGCDQLAPTAQQENDAEVTVSSVSQRLAHGDRTVCADPDVQETAIAALVTDDVLEEYKAVGGAIDFDAVSAKGSNSQIAEVTCSAYLELLKARFELTYAVRPAAQDENEYVVQASVPFSAAELNSAFEIATIRLQRKIFEAGGPEAAALDLPPFRRSLFEARVEASRKREQDSLAFPQVETKPEGNNSAAAASAIATAAEADAASATDTVD